MKRDKKRVSAKEGIALLFGIAAIGTALWNILPTYLDHWGSARTYKKLEKDYVDVGQPEMDAEEEKEETDTREDSFRLFYGKSKRNGCRKHRRIFILDIRR